MAVDSFHLAAFILRSAKSKINIFFSLKVTYMETSIKYESNLSFC
jgi:hypothetical protein